MSTTMSIAEVSRRSGFAPATLRYYEQLGLLEPPARTAAGYRSYEEPVLARLALIARAKTLGCSLAEIADLMPDWETGQCGPVQDRLRSLAEAKVTSTQARIGELLALTASLQDVIAALVSHTPEGACDAQCGCVTVTETTGLAPAPGVACTLEPNQMPGRIQDWKALLAGVVRRTAVHGGVRLELEETTQIDDVARLVRAEQSCCRFFAFAITVDDRGLALEVRAPSEAQSILTSLFGGAAVTAPA